MTRWITPGREFFERVTTYRESSFRWECQGTYREPDEAEPFRLWREGRADNSFMTGWMDTIRGLRQAGKTFERVRLVTEPPTEYLRWMLSFTHLNIEAGEDIRWITQSRARALGTMPKHDFYLIDNESVAILEFGERGVIGAELTGDPDIVAEHRRWRDLVWPAATPHAEFVSTADARSP